MRNLLNAKAGRWLWLALLVAPASYGACTYSITPSTRSHGYGMTTNTVTVTAGIGCAWTAVSTNAWLTIQSGASGSATGVVSYAVSANANSIGRTGVVTIAGQLFTVAQDGAPCNYSVTPTTRNHGSGGVAVATPIVVSATTNCAWSVVNTSSWINLTGATNGVGNGSVPYGVLANPTPVKRTGNVLIADQIFMLTQSPASCIYEFTPTNRLHGYAGSTGLVSVATIPVSGGCQWFVDNTNSWITITANPTGTNSGTLGYTVAANPNNTPRNGTFGVWDQTYFTVFQNPAPCSYSIAPSSSTPGAEPETNVVTVTAIGGCAWGVTNTNSWVSFVGPTNGTGNGSVSLVTAANASMTGRTGVVSIAGQNFTLRQDAASCSYKLSATNRVHGYSATTNSVNLTVASVCSWTVVNTNPWVTIFPPAGGTGGGTTTYSLSQNNGAGDRFGVVLIGGQPLNITQHGVGCAISASPMTRNHGYGSASNIITVTTGAGCIWAVLNTNAWISVVGSTNGVGSNVVTYLVASNPSSSARSGYITIEEAVVMISQNAAPCSYSLTPDNYSHSAAQETGTVSVASIIGCAWTVNNTNTWIAILSGTNGTGSSDVTYSVSPNLNPATRTGLVTVASQLYTVIQDGVMCSYKIAPTNRTHGYAATTNTMTMTVSNPCPWSVVNTNPWLTILSGASGVGSGTITYAVSANALSPNDRVGSVVVGGQVSTITQHGIPCTYSISPSLRNHGNGATTNTITATASAACGWTVVNTNPWITILSGATGTGTGAVTYAVSANPGATARSGVVVVGDQSFALTQAGASSSANFAFESISMGSTGQVILTLVGGPNGVWDLQSSPNLTTWATFASVTNTTGRVVYTAPATGSTKKFYRATLNASACTFALSPGARNHGYGAASNSVDITTSSNCTWAVVNTNAWITIRSGLSGTNSGTLNYTVAANTNLTARSGSVLIGDQTFVVNQAAYLCNYKLSPTNRTHGFGANTNSANISVGAGCAWALVNTNDWITITSPTSGVGSNSFTYAIAANFGSTPRVGLITLDDQSLTITQLGATNGFSFESAAVNTGGGLTVRLAGAPAGIWELQASSNLVNWVKVADLTNTTGRVEYTAPAPLSAKRFFRAVLP